MDYKLIGDDKCFVCGPNNPPGLKIPFEVDRAGKKIRCEFTPGATPGTVYLILGIKYAVPGIDK